MPTPIEQTLAIIFSGDSKLRESTPLIYQMPDKEESDNEKRMRWHFLTNSATNSVKHWLTTEYGTPVLQTLPLEENKDQSEMFALIRDPKERWWSGVREWMHNLPWYSWWENEKLMDQWPHFNRFTIAQHVTLDQAPAQHYIKVDHRINDRMVNFARKHRLRLYGPFRWVQNKRHNWADRKKMEDKGRSQLEKWLAKNPTYQKKLDDYLEPDYQYWNKVKHQD